MAYVFNPLLPVGIDQTGSGGGGGTPGGSDTQVQFNDGGAFGGDAGLVYDKTTNKLTAGGDVELNDGGSFTTTLQTVTPTANRTISFPNATGTVALVAGSSGQLVVNQSGAYAGVANSSVDNATGNITLGSRFISTVNGAADASPVRISGTWFAGTSANSLPALYVSPTGTSAGTSWATAGTGIGVNAPAAFAGNLLDLQVNGTAILNATAVGGISAPRSALDGGNLAGYLFRSGAEVLGFRCDTSNNIGVFTRGAQPYSSYMFGSAARPIFKLGAAFSIAWGTNDVAVQANEDLIILRDAADTLAQRRTTNAQTFRCYGTYTDASNYVRASLSSTSTAVTLAAETAGTGADNIPLNLTAAGTGTVKVNSVAEVVVSSTVAGLPAAPVVGMLTRVTDALAPAVGTTVAGGGAAAALCWYNGANWSVIGV